MWKSRESLDQSRSCRAEATPRVAGTNKSRIRLVLLIDAGREWEDVEIREIGLCRFVHTLGFPQTHCYVMIAILSIQQHTYTLLGGRLKDSTRLFRGGLPNLRDSP